MTPIIKVDRNAWQRVHADDSGVIVDAADYYHAVYRAISGARSYVLMSGWQFDSGVPLLRGPDVPAGTDVRFLKFLDGLCRRRPELRVYLIAWDFHMIFAGEREWFQRVYFHWMTASNLHFRFDDHPAAGDSHHQKFVVVDGGLTFLGGMDVCESRWDDRHHRADNPLRVSHGRPHKPYHDVQAWLAGRAPARALEDVFSERWRRAGARASSWVRPVVPMCRSGARCPWPGRRSRSAGPIHGPTARPSARWSACSRMRSPPLTVSSTSRRSTSAVGGSERRLSGGCVRQAGPGPRSSSS